MAQTQSDEEARSHTTDEKKKTRGRQDGLVLLSMSNTDAEERWPEPNDDADSPAEPLNTPRKPHHHLCTRLGAQGA